MSWQKSTRNSTGARCDRCRKYRCLIKTEYLKRAFFAMGRGELDLSCDDFDRSYHGLEDVAA